MLKKLFSVFFLFVVCSCTAPVKHIVFKELTAGEFINQLQNDTLQKSHDSCMGFAFNANLLLFKTESKPAIGDIIDKRTMHTVGTLNDLGLSAKDVFDKGQIITVPCFNTQGLNTSVTSLIGKNTKLNISNDSAVNREFNYFISNYESATIEMGGWLYIDLSTVLETLLDTATAKTFLLYKTKLTDSNNVVLVKSQALTEVSFSIVTKVPISLKLQNVLRSKPVIKSDDSFTYKQFFYLSDHSFSITFNGYFPVLGQLMKAEDLITKRSVL